MERICKRWPDRLSCIFGGLDSRAWSVQRTLTAGLLWPASILVPQFRLVDPALQKNEIVLAFPVLQPKVSHVHRFGTFWLNLAIDHPLSTVELSVWMGVQGCG